MASSTPTIKQIAWISLVPHLLVMVCSVYCFYLLGFRNPLLLGAFTYVILSIGLRTTVAKSHRSGMRLVKQQRFDEAIPMFEKSVQFFVNKNWVDKYRFITILSSSKMTYKEMGLCNIAFCYSQIGNGQKAKECYMKVLEEFPENGLAVAALNMLNSMEKANT